MDQQETPGAQSLPTAGSLTGSTQTFRSPGLSSFKLVVTVCGVMGITALFIFIAIREGMLNQFSTTTGLIFLAGFVIYLWVMAPVPFTIILSPEGITRVPKKGAGVQAAWAEVSKIKEEINNKRVTISLTVYKGTLAKKKLFAVYRDDIPNLDELRQALQAASPPTCAWECEEVHE